MTGASLNQQKNLANTYMWLWVRMEDILFSAFLIPKKTPSNPQLVGFYLSLPMEYIDSDSYLCMVTEAVADLATKAIGQRDDADMHPLE